MHMLHNLIMYKTVKVIYLNKNINNTNNLFFLMIVDFKKSTVPNDAYVHIFNYIVPKYFFLCSYLKILRIFNFLFYRKYPMNITKKHIKSFFVLFML